MDINLDYYMLFDRLTLLIDVKMLVFALIALTWIDNQEVCVSFVDRCFQQLYPHCLVLDLFQEWIQGCLHNHTKIN